MGPLLVVDMYKPIEALLLLEEVPAGRSGGFLLQRQMHAFEADP